MPIYKMKPAEDVRRRTGTSLTAETAPLLRGDGDMSYVCGSCDTVLVENVSPGDIRSFYVHCPQCNAVSFLDSEAR